MAKKMLWFGTKLAILNGTIYCTNEIGIWGDSVQTTQLLEDITNFVKPYISKNTPVVTSKPLPSMAEVSASTKTYWNKGVWNSTLFLADLPSNIASWTTSGVQFITQQIQEQIEGKKVENE
ncbi:MICOS complex subunit MIC13 homolog QIL1-like isoform X2 [Lycorma delicatula]|uniref:MICOS complex subunit MIC13 homolog QIL1-like isoform X2 n=1 Tax=Lycorma delicatula TaxID=130591 RepID=UPI003F5159AA